MKRKRVEEDDKPAKKAKREPTSYIITKVRLRVSQFFTFLGITCFSFLSCGQKVQGGLHFASLQFPREIIEGVDFGPKFYQKQEEERKAKEVRAVPRSEPGVISQRRFVSHWSPACQQLHSPLPQTALKNPTVIHPLEAFLAYVWQPTNSKETPSSPSPSHPTSRLPSRQSSGHSSPPSIPSPPAWQSDSHFSMGLPSLCMEEMQGLPPLSEILDRVLACHPRQHQSTNRPSLLGTLHRKPDPFALPPLPLSSTLLGR